MPAKGKYDLDVSLSHGTARQNKRRGLKIQQKKLRKEGEAQSKKIKRIGYAEKAAKVAIAVDTAVGAVTAAGLARKAAKAVAKKASTLIINKGSKYGARTSKSQATDIVKKTAKHVREANKKKAKGGGAGKKMDRTGTPEVKGRDPIVPRSSKTARQKLDANKKAATPKKKPQRKNADPYDDPNYLLDKEMTNPPGKWSRARVSQVKKSKKKADRKEAAKKKRNIEITRSHNTTQRKAPFDPAKRDYKNTQTMKRAHKNASSANTAADRRKLGIKNKSADFEDPTTKGGKNRKN